ncbi:MAG: YceD family protein [Galactobacter sp.]
MGENVLEATPNPASPWVFGVQDLVRVAGTMREESGVFRAPADLSLALIGVEEGSDVETDLRLEAVHEGVLATGTATVHVTGECGRCLDPIVYDLDVDLQELFFSKDRIVQGEDDEEQFLIENDYIDLEPVLRDAVVTNLPFQPVCREDCQGLCAQCGVRLDENPGHHHDVVDPRWAALQGLTNDTE